MKTPVERVLDRDLARLQDRASAIFFWLLIAQWLLAVALALLVSPYTWAGATATVHTHVYVAVGLGALLNALPLYLLRHAPRAKLTRQLVAVVQVLWSAILIHITGGRIETHFHVFGSLAFLALYRDPWVLPTAAAAVAADHLVRGLLWPESVYGIANPAWWRFLEHAAWVVFEVVVLMIGIQATLREMRLAALHQTELAALNKDIEGKVSARTAELSAANARLQTEMTTRLQREVELRQSHKLESVGRLAAGVAHEINTPVQFASDSIHFVREALPDLFDALAKLQAIHTETPPSDGVGDAARREVDAVLARTGLPSLAADLPSALDLALSGLERVATIVRSMREFAHPDQHDLKLVDVNQAVETVLLMAKSEYEPHARVSTELGEIPHVLCVGVELSQALLAIVVNAAHAVAEAVDKTGRDGVIQVKTERAVGEVVISVRDNGLGVPEAIRERLFDPFFTTKEVGRGTGQGLSVARASVERHGGAIAFASEVGVGTTFTLRLPIAGPPDADEKPEPDHVAG